MMVAGSGVQAKMLNFCSIINPCKNGGSMKGEEGDEESKIEVTEKMEVQQRGIRIAIRRGPRAPGVSKGQHPQTS